ncbi:DUF72 domain-containing protein [Rhodopirellula halodulae]|uniref:DUF72 domain-containing protein n=1 Tax=Rhodopirellula halodulae TaxID=2894198 RepID=UPI001E3B4C9F|nr:DUF72 domain-containing protein [Rhodopirellula sp. JC737]MCC9657391.1 DUF72 domain-containing protein [Rhodopirellula sp. JC737]
MNRPPDPFVSPCWPVAVGAPVWGCDGWAEMVYPTKTPRKDWLAWYTRTLNTVEGNSTFYAVPGEATFRGWAEQAAEGFEFCFKFPRRISHDSMLQHCDDEVREFLSRLRVIAKAERLGPTFLQLGPSFAPDRLPVLARFLRRLPRELPWAVELRHHDWFDSADNESRVNDLLRDLGIDKVTFDSRPLFQSPPDDAIEEKSQGRKPKTPVRQTVTASRPMVRIVGRNRVEMADSFLDQWVPIVMRWLEAGLRPIIFTHTPDDRLAPEFAARLLAKLAKAMPGVDFTLPRPPQSPEQLSLLD